MKDPTARRANPLRILANIAVAAVIALTGTAIAAGPAAAGEPADSHKIAKFEKGFMKETIEHHYLGVKMGELCVEKVTDAPPTSDRKLLETCEQIIVDQTKQIKKLQKWLKNWYHVWKPAELPDGGQAMLDELAALEGEAFDVAVSKMFIEHHKEFLPMGDKCADKADHNKLERLCEEMVDAQRKEIKVFKWILKDHKKHADHGHKWGHDGHKKHGH